MSASIDKVEKPASPPFSLEQAVDLILAMPAHRSSNAGHAAFGKTLIDEYIVKLREKYQDDSVAYTYLTELFAAAASAIRAFSVQRDIYEAERKAQESLRDFRIEKAKRSWEYSLLDDFRGQIGTLFAGMTLTGLGVFLNAGYKSVAALPAVWLAVIIWDIMVRYYGEYRLEKAVARFPKASQKNWQEEAINKYKQIIVDFVVVAAGIQARHYPDSWIGDVHASLISDDGMAAYGRAVAARHMSFD